MAENRSQGIFLPIPIDKIGLPPRVFMYTIDQLSMMLGMTELALAQGHIYFEGRSIGSRKKTFMIARNVAADDREPDWRIVDREFIRWMKLKGFRYYDRGAVSN